jgi:hypothetical protein
VDQPTIIASFQQHLPDLPISFATSSWAQNIQADRILWRAPPVSTVQVTDEELQSIGITSRNFNHQNTPPQSSCGL